MSIGNCPRCGAQTDDENDLCYQCALRRMKIELSDIDFTPYPLPIYGGNEQCKHAFEYVTNDFFQFKVCRLCSAIAD